MGAKGKSAVKANNAGMPTDRRETKMTMMGLAPHGDVPLKGSGYERKWPGQSTSIAGAGTLSTSKANGGARSKVNTKRGPRG